VPAIGQSPGDAIVAAVTELAHVLGLSVIAEGVETDQQRDQVGAIGCDCSQGFFYARPMSADAISRHLEALRMGPLHRPAAPLRLPTARMGPGRAV
jgi:EAL domain-containing protein (putative c-di-GMP-specific phosphodiesterase class I)